MTEKEFVQIIQNISLENIRKDKGYYRAFLFFLLWSDEVRNIVYPQLKKNPFYGTNIKKLKGEYEGVYRYRLGNYRLFYIIDNDKVIVIVTTISHRQSAY
jgi:mRNA interferase RelE/StbE